MNDTIYLNPDNWDLALTTSYDIAIANPPYSVAQDAASACRLWEGEYIYDITKGIPYETDVLGQLLPSNVLSSFYNKAAQDVPGVASVSTLLNFNRETRMLSGQINLTLEDGAISVINV